jgi:hypothetical protein
MAIEDEIDSESGDQGLTLDGGHKILRRICPINNVITIADHTLILILINSANINTIATIYTIKACEVFIY